MNRCITDVPMLQEALFFTVTLAERRYDTLIRHIEDLHAAMKTVKEKHPFSILAMVVLPEHLHALWRLPPGDADYPLRWPLITKSMMRRMTNPASHDGWQKVSVSEPAARPGESAASGCDGIGNIKSGTKSTLHSHIERGIVTADWGARSEGLGMDDKLDG